MIDHPKSVSDWDAIRRICCETAKSGDPIEQDRWEFFGEQWIQPYERLRPEWVYVFREGAEVLGYLTGCPDTRAFEREKLFRVAPSLAAGIVSRRYAWNVDTARYLRRLFRMEKSPAQCLSGGTRQMLESEFPAHLHINFDPRARGKGTGRALIDAFTRDLRAKGVPGVHVHCGAQPVEFYRKTGFEELERLEYLPGVWVFALGKRIG